jgi:hypothetical protein
MLTNTLAYNRTELIMAIKNCTAQGPGQCYKTFFITGCYQLISNDRVIVFYTSLKTRFRLACRLSRGERSSFFVRRMSDGGKSFITSTLARSN